MPAKSNSIAFETESLLPSRRPSATHNRRKNHRKSRTHSVVAWIILVNLSLAAIATIVVIGSTRWFSPAESPPFYARVKTPYGICNTEDGKGVSHSGYIELEGDSEENPKRSFFWYFEAQKNPDSAPVILTVAGGPGAAGMVPALGAQSHCLVTENGTVPNPNAWSKRFNLVALDHPIGAGFSYGTMVNNSRAAAMDVYDFLQKFYILYPHLVQNKLVLSGGSYGGTYVPHIATVIHDQNRAIALSEGNPRAIHIHLESLMISSPYSDAMSHFRWWLDQACYNTNLYNSTTCEDFFKLLPSCLESIQFAYEISTVKNRIAAFDNCQRLLTGDTHGTMIENVSKKCPNPEDCFPQYAHFDWISDFLNRPSTKAELGVPASVDFQVLNPVVSAEFLSTGDFIQQAYLLYEPLLEDGIRLLHYTGAKDAHCGWPGVLSFLKLLRSPYQERFIHAPDIPWPSKTEATVRVVGDGAGMMAYILIADGGHFVAREQPALVKNIVEHWIDNLPFL